MRPIKVSRQESHISVPLKSIRLGDVSDLPTASSLATGFFWERAGTWYLVTNLHVVTGWDAVRNRPLSENAFYPTHVDVKLALETRSGSDSEPKLVKRSEKRFALAENEMPVWLEHPTFRSLVDVAVIPVFLSPTPEHLTEIESTGMASIAANLHDDWTEFALAAGDDAYILGYPKGMSGGGFPLWKRGSIASEPDIDLDGLPKLLIDSATRQGMSGSPVTAIRRGIIMPNGKFDEECIIGEAAKFVGIYSGRIGEDELGVQLGIVWKARVIDEIIDGGCKGEWPWDLTTHL